MSNDPDQIRQDIERTQGNLSYNVDQLTETVRPGNVARRQADKVAGAATGLKDKAEPLVEEAKDVAKEAADNFEPKAQQAGAVGQGLGHRLSADHQAGGPVQRRGRQRSSTGAKSNVQQSQDS